MTNIAVASFRWLDALEKEFDKSFVDLESLFMGLHGEIDSGDLSEESVSETIESARDRIKEMCSSWSQLVHKAQTIFQMNCKLEAQIVNLKSDLVEARAFRKASEKELEKLMIELHTSQLQFQKLKSSSGTNSQPNSNNTSLNGDSDADLIQKRLEEEMQRRFNASNEHMNQALLQAELDECKKENAQLKEQIVNLNSEIYGSRLAAKYLDKELAGRIQQIQLFGKNLKNEDHERLWNQLEAEIHLHRQKTVIRSCRHKRNQTRIQQRKAAELTSSGSQTTITMEEEAAARSHLNDDIEALRRANLLGKLRLVTLKRNDPKEGLGISITGGREHGVPILISDIHDNGPASRSGKLFVGDAILAVNGIDLKEAMHSEAVEVLSNLSGDINLHVVFIAQEEDSDPENASVNDLA